MPAATSSATPMRICAKARELRRFSSSLILGSVCALLSGGNEGGFRHGLAGAGQRSLSTDRATHAGYADAQAHQIFRDSSICLQMLPSAKRKWWSLSPPRTPADPSSVRSHGKTYRRALVEWITLTPDNLRWTSKHVAHLAQLLSVETQAR
jgi:hypothetical protein